MPGFDAIYKQTITLFNRIKGSDGETYWYPTKLTGVHLVDNHSSTWNNQGGSNGSTAMVHIMYQIKGGAIYVAGKPYYTPKDYRLLDEPENAITFSFGHHDDSDFFIEGEFDFDGAISDDAHDRHGFYNYMKKVGYNVYSITSATKYNLIPHFEINGR